jgi:hypothetical protein
MRMNIYGDFMSAECAESFCKAVEQRHDIQTVIYHGRYGDEDHSWEAGVERTFDATDDAVHALAKEFGVENSESW